MARAGGVRGTPSSYPNNQGGAIVRDEELVGVTLNPALAKEVACALRIQLASELDRPFDEPLPSREDVARLRTVL